MLSDPDEKYATAVTISIPIWRPPKPGGPLAPAEREWLRGWADGAERITAGGYGNLAYADERIADYVRRLLEFG